MLGMAVPRSGAGIVNNCKVTTVKYVALNLRNKHQEKKTYSELWPRVLLRVAKSQLFCNETDAKKCLSQWQQVRQRNRPQMV